MEIINFIFAQKENVQNYYGNIKQNKNKNILIKIPHLFQKIDDAQKFSVNTHK